MHLLAIVRCVENQPEYAPNRRHLGPKQETSRTQTGDISVPNRRHVRQETSRSKTGDFSVQKRRHLVVANHVFKFSPRRAPDLRLPCLDRLGTSSWSASCASCHASGRAPVHGLLCICPHDSEMVRKQMRTLGQPGAPEKLGSLRHAVDEAGMAKISILLLAQKLRFCLTRSDEVTAVIVRGNNHFLVNQTKINRNNGSRSTKTKTSTSETY